MYKINLTEKSNKDFDLYYSDNIDFENATKVKSELITPITDAGYLTMVQSSGDLIAFGNKIPKGATELKYGGTKKAADSWKAKGLDNPLNLNHMRETAGTLELTGPAGVNGREGLNNILIEDNSKYCSNRSADHTVTFKFRDPFYVTGYGYKTANDCASRDPGIFTLVGKKEDNSEIFLHTANVTSEDSLSRFTWKKYLVDKPTKVTEIKFVVHRVYEDISEYGRAIQFSEFKIYSLPEDEVLVPENDEPVLSAKYSEISSGKAKKLWAGKYNYFLQR